VRLALRLLYLWGIVIGTSWSEGYLVPRTSLYGVPLPGCHWQLSFRCSAHLTLQLGNQKAQQCEHRSLQSKNTILSSGHFPLSRNIFLRFILMLSSVLNPRYLTGCFPSGFATKFAPISLLPKSRQKNKSYVSPSTS
jgi:hypothetical protein